MTYEVRVHRRVTSAGAAVSSEPVKVAAQPANVQLAVPAAATLVAIEGSNDKVNWSTLNDLAGTPLAALGDGLFEIRETPTWLRFTVALDAAAPRNYEGVFNVERGGSR